MVDSFFLFGILSPFPFFFILDPVASVIAVTAVRVIGIRISSGALEKKNVSVPLVYWFSARPEKWFDCILKFGMLR